MNHCVHVDISRCRKGSLVETQTYYTWWFHLHSKLRLTECYMSTVCLCASRMCQDSFSCPSENLATVNIKRSASLVKTGQINTQRTVLTGRLCGGGWFPFTTNTINRELCWKKLVYMKGAGMIFKMNVLHIQVAAADTLLIAWFCVLKAYWFSKLGKENHMTTLIWHLSEEKQKLKYSSNRFLDFILYIIQLFCFRNGDGSCVQSINVCFINPVPVDTAPAAALFISVSRAQLV